MKETTPDIFAEALDDVLAHRRTIRQCTANHPEVGTELETLLQLATEIKPPLNARMPRTVRDRLRSQVMGQVRRDASRPQPEERPGLRLLVSPGTVLRSWRPASALQAVTAGVVAALTLFGTSAYAAQGAVPGDHLYSLKRMLERGEYIFADYNNPYTHLNLADRRLEEMVKLVQLGREDQVGGLAAEYRSEITQAVVLLGLMESADDQAITGFQERLRHHEEILGDALRDTSSSRPAPHLSEAMATTRGARVQAGLLGAVGTAAAADPVEQVLTGTLLLGPLETEPAALPEWVATLRGNMAALVATLNGNSSEEAVAALASYRQSLAGCLEVGCGDETTSLYPLGAPDSGTAPAEAAPKGGGQAGSAAAGTTNVRPGAPTSSSPVAPAGPGDATQLPGSGALVSGNTSTTAPLDPVPGRDREKPGRGQEIGPPPGGTAGAWLRGKGNADPGPKEGAADRGSQNSPGHARR